MILLGTLQAQRARFVASWSGAWIVDVDAVLGDTHVAPTGSTVLTIGTTPLIGTIDPLASGVNGELFHARIVAGAGGWSKTVPALAFHNDAGVLSSVVRAETAAEVGEVVVDAVPSVLGTDYARLEGLAASVLPRDGWYVDLTGVTIAGPRVLAPFDPLDVSILEWDPLTQVATLASDGVILPGTILIDPKFGTAVVRSIDQTFDGDGSRATAHCSDITSTGTSKLASALGKFVRAAAGADYARPYLYRVVAQNPLDGRLILQAVVPAAGAPDIGPIAMWSGVPGATAKVTPGMLVIVEFAGGDAGSPIVRSFDATPPIEIDLLALTAIKLTAPSIAFVGNATFGPPGTAQALAFGPWAAALQAALVTFATGLSPANVAANGAALLTALGTLPPSSTVLMKGA